MDPTTSTRRGVRIFYGPSLEALWGITFSRYRGLFFYAPILVFAIGGAIVRLRRRERLGELTLIASIALVFLGFNITFNGWRGGDAIGPRYLIPIIPFLGLLICDAIAPTSGIRLAPALRVWFAVISLVLNFTITAVDAQPAEMIRDPVGTYILSAVFVREARRRSCRFLIRIGGESRGIRVGESRFDDRAVLPLVELQSGELLFRAGQPCISASDPVSGSSGAVGCLTRMRESFACSVWRAASRPHRDASRVAEVTRICAERDAPAAADAPLPGVTP